MNYRTQQVMDTTVIWYEKDGVRVSFVDPSPDNADYQRYLEWVAAGNSPEPWEG